jgi:hypothetical protein
MSGPIGAELLLVRGTLLLAESALKEARAMQR